MKSRNIDVNVHPSKKYVKFINEIEICDAISKVFTH